MSELATTQSSSATRSVRLPPFAPLLPGAGAAHSRAATGSRRSSRLLFVPPFAVRAARSEAAVAQPVVEAVPSEEVHETPVAPEHAALESWETERPHDDYSAAQPPARLLWTTPILEPIEAPVSEPTPALETGADASVQPEAEAGVDVPVIVVAAEQPAPQAEAHTESHPEAQSDAQAEVHVAVQEVPVALQGDSGPADELSDALAWPEASTATSIEPGEPLMAAPDQALAGIAEELHDSAAPWAQPAEAEHDNDAWSRTALAEMFPDPRATVAASLERIAQRIRDGDVSISRDASTSTDASALAAVLAALLRETARQ